MKTLRLLMIGDVVPWHPMAGGAAVTPFGLARALARAGHSVHYVALAPRGLQREVEWGNIIYVESTNRYISPFLQYLKTRDQLTEYDIVHAHGVEGLGFAIHKKLLRDITYVNGFYLGTVGRFPWGFRSPFDPYCYLSCRWADMVITTSEDTRSRISRAYRIAEPTIRVMYAGVDDSFFARKIPQNSSNRFRLLFCGYLGGAHHVKGLDVLLESLPAILARHDVTLYVIGTGERIEQYRAKCGALGIGERVSFLGFIEHSKLSPYYSNADLLVLPSRSESFGLVLVEAMASGLPVVATRVGGIPEVVDDGLTGLLVAPDDALALAEAVNSLLDDPERMRAMGAIGRERVKEHFTWVKVAERVADFYQEIL